jgi:hypothetical protein
VFVLGILRRRRNRERLEQLRREEYMLPPGPPPGEDLDEAAPANDRREPNVRGAEDQVGPG